MSDEIQAIYQQTVDFVAKEVKPQGLEWEEKGKVPREILRRLGGLGCFGEAVPAQALAQVCELTWQLRGQAGERQVENARIGITANQGLFGHGSSVLCVK